MKAITFSEFSGPEALRVVEKASPTPRAGEVVIRVSASAVNPTDVMSLRGFQADLMKVLTPPYTAGMEFSGHVLSVGPGVTSVTTGQRVIGVVSSRRPGGGAHAEQICVPAASIAPVAEGVDLVAASTVPMNALTGLLCLELLHLTPGKTLLVTGAAGMLGSLSVQLAAIEQLHILANARETDREFLTRLGVKTILPRDEGLEDALRRACPEGVHGVIDGALIGQRISHLVRDGGVMVSPRTSYRIEDPRLEITYVQVTKGLEDHAKLARIAQLLEDGRLTPRVAPHGTFPIENAADAYRMAEAGGFRGRVVITFSD